MCGTDKCTPSKNVVSLIIKMTGAFVNERPIGEIPKDMVETACVFVIYCKQCLKATGGKGKNLPHRGNSMELSKMRDILEAEVLCGEERLEEEVETLFASDMMSDVLACPDEIQCLLTNLINQQVIRTSDMLDIGVVIFVHGKQPAEDVVEMARQRDMALLRTECRMFTACGRLYEAGLR